MQRSEDFLRWCEFPTQDLTLSMRKAYGAQEASELVNCWLCRHKHPSVVLRTHLKKPGYVPIILMLGEAEKGVSLGLASQSSLLGKFCVQGETLLIKKGCYT